MYHQNMQGLCGCLLVTRMTVSVAGVDSTTTWWMYKRVCESPRLWQSDQPASLYLFCGFRPWTNGLLPFQKKMLYQKPSGRSRGTQRVLKHWIIECCSQTSLNNWALCSWGPWQQLQKMKESLVFRRRAAWACRRKLAACACLICLLEEGHGIFPKPDHLKIFVIALCKSYNGEVSMINFLFLRKNVTFTF